MRYQHDDNKPLVSFIITYYNLPIEMLIECVESILALSLSENEREIILVDDGSDHCPLDDLKAYRDEIVYIRQRNSGLSVSRNTGLEMCKGRYVQFVDGDDALIQAPYEHCLDTIRYDQETDIVLFESTQKQSVQAVFQSSEPESGTAYMYRHNLHATSWGYLFRRSILGGLRFTPGIFHEDEEFTPQLILRAEKVVSTNAKAYLYRRREDSIINNSDMRHKLRRLNDTERVIFHLNRLADKLPRNESMALRRRVHQLTMDYLYNTIMLTQSRHQLEKRISKLEKEGLFPLPERKYTNKYRLFRLFVNNGIGRNILNKVLPMVKRR